MNFDNKLSHNMYIPLRYGQSKGFPFNLMVAKLVVFDHECVLNYKLEKVRLLKVGTKKPPTGL